jgi:hypothetical protein
MSSSGALACSFALRLATPRRLAAALAAAAPSEDIPTLLPTEICNGAVARTAASDRSQSPLCGSAPSEARPVRGNSPSPPVRTRAKAREPPPPRPAANTAEALGRTTADRARPLGLSPGRRGMSSEGAAGASAAARPRGAASRKATLQARAPEGDIPRRPRAMHPDTARTTMPEVRELKAAVSAGETGRCRGLRPRCASGCRRRANSRA